MTITKAIKTAMKRKGYDLRQAALLMGYSRPNDVSARLVRDNLYVSQAVRMLNALGYELVVQEVKRGNRRADQIVVDMKKEE